MKKTLVKTLAIILLIIVTVTITYTTNYLYSSVGIITEVNENNLITVTLKDGNMYQFSSETKNWTIGDSCNLIMYDNNTKTIYDDKIVSCR